MANPFVREVGRIADIDGLLLSVGVDYNCISIGDYRLSAGLAEEFTRLFFAAAWQAAEQHGAGDPE